SENRITLARIGGRFLEPAFVVRKAERIRRANLDLRFLGGPFVEQDRGVLAGPNAPVEAAIRADVEVAHEFLAQIRVPALVTLFPGVRRNLVLFVPRKAGLLFLAEPGH